MYLNQYIGLNLKYSLFLNPLTGLAEIFHLQVFWVLVPDIKWYINFENF